MQVLRNAFFQDQIEDNLCKLPSKINESFAELKKRFPEDKINLVGGFVRDSILQVLYKHKSSINDLDLLIEDLDFSNKIKNFPGGLSRVGKLKLEYDNFSLDVLGVKEVYFFNAKKSSEKNLENFLLGCDLSTSAFAYNLDNKNIYGVVKSIEDVYNKEINPLNDYMEIAPTISRLILHADKIGFKIGDFGVSYIKKNYSKQIDKQILEYLAHKKLEHFFPLVKNKIALITRL